MLLGQTEGAVMVAMGVSPIGVGNKVQERDQRRVVVRGELITVMARECAKGCWN